MKKSAVRESFESLIIAVALALFARTFVFQAFKIPSGSMEKGLIVGRSPHHQQDGIRAGRHGT